MAHNYIRKAFLVLGILWAAAATAQEREPIWPKGKMPDPQDHQIAAMTDEVKAEKFKPAKHRTAYIEWFAAPAEETRNGGCMILISGGSYMNCCDVGLIKKWNEELTALGFQCVNFVYRTPRPVGLPIYQSAWEDGQRAVRMVRSEAAKRGFDPERIGTISMSAGSHLALLLATSSQTPAYERVDDSTTSPATSTGHRQRPGIRNHGRRERRSRAIRRLRRGRQAERRVQVRRKDLPDEPAPRRQGRLLPQRVHPGLQAVAPDEGPR